MATRTPIFRKLGSLLKTPLPLAVEGGVKLKRVDASYGNARKYPVDSMGSARASWRDPSDLDAVPSNQMEACVVVSAASV